MNGQDSQHILYLDTRSFPLERDRELSAAREAGLSVVIATASTDSYSGFDVSNLIEVPIGDFETSKTKILQYLNSHNINIAGVIAWGDKPVELAARIGTALGLPCTTPNNSQNVRNKVNTRKLLDRLNSVNPKYKVIQTYEEFKDALELIGVPCILKPAGASFGRGIFRINAYDDADSIFRSFREYCVPSRDEVYSYFSDSFLLEEYLEGTEHSVAGMVADGEVYILAIADKKIDKSIPFQYENIVPSKLPRNTQNKIVNLSKSAVELLGINWCGFHIDIIVRNDIPKILEVGGRLGGETINSHLIPLSNPDLKPYELILKIVQGEVPLKQRCFVSQSIYQAGIRAFLPKSPGKITCIEGFEKVRKHPNTRDFIQLKDIGDTVYLPSEKLGEYAIGYVVAQCSKDEDIEEILADLASLCHIETE